MRVRFPPGTPSLINGKMNMKHKLKLQTIYFDKIQRGEKIYEVRLNDEKRQQIKIGNTLLLRKEPELKTTLEVKVVDLIYFASFDALVNTLPLEKIGFSGVSKTAVKNIYRQFYTEENEKRYGVVAIKLQR